MADPSCRLELNINGPLYVDWSCIYCGLCVEYAPQIFARNDALGVAYVHNQPKSRIEADMAMQALKDCPLESIGWEAGINK